MAEAVLELLGREHGGVLLTSELKLAAAALDMLEGQCPPGLVARLSETLKSASFNTSMAECLRVCICLGVKPQYRALMLDSLLLCGDRIEKLIAEVSDAYHSADCVASATRDTRITTLSYLLVLLTLILSPSELTCSTVIDVFMNNVFLSMTVVTDALGKALGGQPGVSCVLSGPTETQVAERLLLLMRHFTSWRSYSALNSGKRIPHRMNASQFGRISGNYRHHVGVVSTVLMKLPLMEEIIASFEWYGIDNVCKFHGTVKELGLLLDSLLTLTDQSISQLRKHIVKSAVVERLAIPFLQMHEAQCQHTAADISLIRFLATLVCGSKCVKSTLRGCWKAFFSHVFDRCVTRLAEHSSNLEYLAQLTRLVINMEMTQDLQNVCAAWKRCGAEGTRSLFRLLTSSPRQFSPLDTCGSCFAAFCRMMNLNHNDSTPTLSIPVRRRRRRYKKLLLELEERAPVEEDALSSASSDASANLHEDESDEDLSAWRTGPPPSKIPIDYICQLTHRFFQSTPVVSPQGHTFDQVSILSYVKMYGRCPITKKPLKEEDLLIDHDLHDRVQCIRDSFLEPSDFS